MKTKLMVTVFMLIAGSVSYAQDYDDDNVEVIEKNAARDANSDSAQEDYSKSKMDAYDTKNSPQINIYNANSNANKQQQKARQQAEADALADADAAATAKNKSANTSNNDMGQEYISRANDIRNDRKNMEVGTEQKMIEKIEYSRIEDEKDRANRLFGNRLDKKYDDNYNNNYNNSYNSNDDYKKPQVIVVEKKPEYVAPAPIVYENETKTTEPSSWWGKESYIAPMVGMMNYSASNVRPDTALGVAVGNRFDTNVSMEASFLYNSMEMDDYTIVTGQDYYGNNVPGVKSINQYSLGGGVKYNFDAGRVSPFVGALASYTWRDYTETRGEGGDTSNSSAIDAGVNIGLDVKIAKNFAIGAEYRWMKNVWYDRTEPDTSSVQYNYPDLDGKKLDALEADGYSAFLVNGKFTF